MSTYPRTDEGFSQALDAASSMARHHDHAYAMIVDAKDPDHYLVSLASLVDPATAAEGTIACLVDGERNLTPMPIPERPVTANA